MRSANALMLQWHAGAPEHSFEVIQVWMLSTLKPLLRFDSAVWGLLAVSEAKSESRVSGVCLQGVSDDVLTDFERVRSTELFERRPAGQAALTCLADARWNAATHAAFKQHARRHGLLNSVSLCFAEAQAPGRQFILLARKAPVDRFTSDEVFEFELLAQHMMQAYATRRRQLLDASRAGDRQTNAAAVAMVDLRGVIHDRHERFLPMLRREWSGWLGLRLPEPMLELAARRAGTRWRFLGERAVADFVPQGDFYLVTVRLRQGADALTPREGQVAQRYAAGENFREIAAALELAPATVRSHLRNVFGKLQVRNKTQLTAKLR